MAARKGETQMASGSTLHGSGGGAVFRHCSDLEIEDYAKVHWAKPGRPMRAAINGCAGVAATVMIVLGFAMLLVPYIGLFLCLGFAGIGFVMLLATGLPTLNYQEWVMIKERYRNLSRGNCPVCGDRISLDPGGDESTTDCPRCRAHLHYDHGNVTPE
jgi:hypothetical protein